MPDGPGAALMDGSNVSFLEPCCPEMAPPGIQIVVRTVALLEPAFLVIAMRIRTKQNATRFQTLSQLPKNACQRLAGDMEQRGIGKNAVKLHRRDPKSQEVLFPDFTTTVGACHLGESTGAFQSCYVVAQGKKGSQITPWTTTEVKDAERRLALDAIEQRSNVLADIMATGALPEGFCILVVM